jgi:hypothetical protein
MKKAFPYILLLVLAIAVLFIKRCRAVPETKKTVTDTVDRNSTLDRRTGFLEYTEHATCRMDCGHITRQAVEYILQNGQVNIAKSETHAHPCPIYALEGYSPEKQHLRIIFAQCDYKTKVITCTGIDSGFDCHCPGVGTKYEH